MIFGRTANDVIQGAIQRAADRQHVGKLRRIADACQNFRKRAERNAGHFGQLVVGDAALAFDLFNSVNISKFGHETLRFRDFPVLFLLRSYYSTVFPFCKEVFEKFFPIFEK